MLEILQKYKDLGVLGESSQDFRIGEGESSVSSTSALAYSYTGGAICAPGCVPVGLGGVLESLIELLDLKKEDMDENLLSELAIELRERKSEIDKQYQYVAWSEGEQSNEENYVNDQYYDGTVQVDEGFSYKPETGETHTSRKWDVFTGEDLDD